ncbi:MAG: MBL fold metallo-hydrolase [Bryobacteraceae bacterium]|nr:MBL fold metallo-hydrolase [Bryobacteraceae bacterium]
MLLRWLTALVLLWLAALAAAQPPASPATIRALARPPFDPARAHDRDFVPSGSLRRLSENLYLYDDSCNVYIIRNGENATLINFGTGDVLKALAGIGVRTIDRVLVTHHHRDQVQGLADLGKYEFLVTVPGVEARYFENVEAFWQSAKIYINYDLRSHWNTLRRSIRVDQKVAGGDRIEWRGIEFRVLDTPGPTQGSVSYSAEVDGRRVVFTGDLIAGAGKVNNWFDLHWDYYGFTQGIDTSEKSFGRVRGESPAWLLPSHGGPIEEPAAAMAENSRVYAQLREMLVPNTSRRAKSEMRQILPHLIHLGGPASEGTGSLTSYAIVSDGGKALIYDYGYVNLEQLRQFKRQYKINHITVTFSHYHDDHIIRTYELLRDGNIDIWVLDKMADVLENPTRYRLPCLIPFPIKASRIVRDGERVKWEGYELEFFHMPGQTEFHQGLATVVDGKKVMFTGDNTWNKGDVKRVRNGPVVPQNEYFLDGGFITCARKMLDYLPDIVLPAHTEEYSPSKADLEEFLDWAYRVREVMTGLIQQPDANFGMDYRWTHFYPFRHVTEGEAPFTVELVVRNHLYKPARVEVRLKLPEGVKSPQAARSFTMEPKSQVAVPFRLQRAAGSGQRVAVTADIMLNGRRLGEVAEMVIE